MPTILVIDDNPAVCTALEVLFSIHGIETTCAHQPDEGLQKIQTGMVDLVIQDMNFTEDTTSGKEGVELFHRIREIDKDLPIILLTAWTHLETAVDLVKSGAADYLAKPWDDNRLVTSVMNLLRMRELAKENRELQSNRLDARQKLKENYDLCGLVYESDAMHELLSVATRVAKSNVPVLITGPNGVGKEMVANIIQANSAAREAPFVKVNVGALPADLMESELFGAEAGAYTGAQKARAGRFEAADGGTLFLDEIGNLPLEGQIKLLRVLQTGEFERLGSTKTRKVNVRLISATNTDLKRAIDAGTFREDLYYRLNVIELDIPPLTRRTEDIVPLGKAFLEQGFRFDSSAERALLKYPWPGNVRELQNRIRRASLLADNQTVTAADLDLGPQETSNTPQHEPNADTIRSALEKAEGVVATAAKELGLSRQALYRRMEKYGIQK